MRNNLLLIISLSLFICKGSFAQNKSDKLYDNFAFASAVKKYEKELASDSGNFEIRHHLALAYTKMNRCQEALDHYVDIITLGSSKLLKPKDWNNIGQLYLGVGKDRNAELAFKFLKDYNPKSLNRQRPIGQLYYSTQPLEGINTVYSEFSPFIIKNDIAFASDRPASNFELNKSKWTETSYVSLFKISASNAFSENVDVHPTLLKGKINDLYHVGPAYFSEELKKLFYTKISPNHKGVNRGEVYVSEIINGKWGKPTAISLNNDSFSVAHPTYLSEKKMLIFSSDMPGGFGGMDLYFSIWENEQWTEPVNFGDKVNTPFNEVFPSIQKGKSNQIYYSSNGRFGYGGLDIYKVILNGTDVESVNILPPKINSNKDDFGVLFTSDTSGFVSSSRDESIGADDIYKFTLDYINIHGCLIDEETGLPIRGHRLFLVNSEQVVIDSIKTSEDGCFEFRKLPYEDISILPEEVDDGEFIIKMKEKTEKKDPGASLFLLSSTKQILDTVPLVDDGILTLYVEKRQTNDKVRCVIYADGEKAVKLVFAVKDSTGFIIDSLTTDNEGCLKIRKLYPEGAFFDLMDDDDGELAVKFIEGAGLTDNSSVTDEEVIIIRRKTTLNDKLSLTGKLIDELDPSKDLSNVRIIIIGQDGFVEYTSTTDENSSFFFKKLPPEHSKMLMIDDEDGVLFGTTDLLIKGTVTPVSNYAVNDDKKKVYLADTDKEKFNFSNVNAKGEFALKVKMSEYNHASTVDEETAFDNISKTDTLVIENIYFELGKATLTFDAEKVLDKLAVAMRDNPGLSIKIDAHTDSRGSLKNNLILSQDRAKSVKEYIQSKGILASKLASEGFGESKLTNKCKDGVQCSEEEHLKNRRTEFILIWK